jgi:hypothetical protein
MNRRFSLVLVAALVVLAGCSGGGSGDGSGGPTTDGGGADTPTATPNPPSGATDTPSPAGSTETATPASTERPPGATATATPVPGATATATPAPGATPAPTATATPAPTATPSPTPAPTATPIPATATPTPTPGDSGAFLDRHEANVETVAGLNVSYTTRSSIDGVVTSGAGSILLDYETDAIRQTQNTTTFFEDGTSVSVITEIYVPPGADTMNLCTRIAGTGCMQKDSLALRDSNRLTDVKSPVTGQTNVTGVPAFRDEGLVETDAGEMRRYVVDDLSQLTDTSDGVTYDTIEMVILYNPETELVYQMQYNATMTTDGSTFEISQTMTYDYGPVEITAPDWY